MSFGLSYHEVREIEDLKNRDSVVHRRYDTVEGVIFFFHYILDSRLFAT